MTLMINCQDVQKTIGPRTLFTSLSFTVNKGDRLAVIGANGSGKTTLLKMVAGLDTPDSGKITFAQHMVVGYLAQQENLDEHSTVLEAVLAELQGEHLDEAEQHNRASTMMSRCGFVDTETPVHTLSGGWRKRLAITLALVHHPDVLVMDEPTNHLDLEGILWLENLLRSSFPGCPSTFILVSHDRLFLENLSTHILEIAPWYPEGFMQVTGNYSSFLKQKEQFLLLQEEQETRLANKVRRESEWLSRGPKARATKAKYRVNEAHRLAAELKQLKSRTRVRSSIEIDFEATGRKTKKLMEVTNLSKSYGAKSIFTKLTLTLTPGKKLGLLGKNGSGKSTLIKILANEPNLKPDQGSIKPADGVKIIYFAQDRKQLNPEITLRQALSPEGDSVLYQNRPVHVMSWAQKFLFRTDQLDTPVKNLSGGEQARILIADLMRQPADILLLDEPSNDLDIPSLQVLEESLLDFPGAVVLVTHDRYMLNRICDYVLGFDGQGGVERFADFEQWHRSIKPEQEATGKKERSSSKKTIDEQAGRLSYLDQREYDSIEDRILELEGKEADLQTVMDNPDNATNPELLDQTWQELESIQQQIEGLYSRWDELETKKYSGS